MNKEYRNESWTAGMLLGLYGLLIVALLLLVFAGARLYRGAERTRQENTTRRSATAYLQGKLVSYDMAEGLRIEQGTFGSVLYLQEPMEGYETRVYLHEGKLMEELSPVSRALDPDNADVICDLNSFTVTPQSDNLLLVTADGKQCYVCIGSEGGVVR